MKKIKTLFILALAVLIASSCKKSKFKPDSDLIIDPQTNEATLTTSTAESVRLAYALNNGKKVSNQIESIMELELEGKSTPMSYYWEGVYEITNVDENKTAQVAYKITRMKIHSNDQGVDFDSGNPKDTTNKETAEFLKKMLNVPGTFQINSQGKIVSQNVDSFVETFGMQFPYIRDLIDQQLNSFVTSSFFPIPNGEIKAGDILSNDTIEQTIQGIPVKTISNYQVKMISKDKRKILVEPKGSISFNLGELPEGSSIAMNQSAISGWLLLDMEKGHVSQSKITAMMDFTSEFNGEKANVVLRSTTNMVAE